MISGFDGEGINNSPKGDLYTTFLTENNTYFKLEKHNLYFIVDLDLYTAILGGEITTKTFNGKVKLSVKPAT